MANKKYLQLGTNGAFLEDSADLTLTSELAAIADGADGASLVGVYIADYANITPAGNQLDQVLDAIDAALLNAGAVTSVNGETGDVVLTSDDINSDHTAVNYTPANGTITGHLSGIDDALAAVVAPLNFQGTFDASAGDYSALAGGSVGDFYKVSVAGTIDGVDYNIGDNLYLNKDVAGTPVTADVDKIDNTDEVTAVNGQIGSVVISGDDVAADHTAVGYTPANANVDGHLSGIDDEIQFNQRNNKAKGFTAGAAGVTAGDPVYVSADGVVSSADAANDTSLEVIGIAENTAASGNAVTVLQFGPSGAIFSGLTNGNPIYLASGGGFTETQVTASGSYSLRVGKATGATTADVNIGQAVQRA